MGNKLKLNDVILECLPPSGLSVEGIDFNSVDVVNYLIKCIPLPLLVHNKRIENIYTVRVNKYKANYKPAAIRVNTDYLAIGLLSAIIYPGIIKQALRVPGLGALGEIQIKCLIGAWLHSKINSTVFCRENILIFDLPVHARIVNHALKELVSIGLLVYVEGVEVHKLTGKFARPNKRLYYKISHSGNVMLKKFFDLYLKEFERLTGEFWDIPLVEKLKDIK